MGLPERVDYGLESIYRRGDNGKNSKRTGHAINSSVGLFDSNTVRSQFIERVKRVTPTNTAKPIIQKHGSPLNINQQ